MTHLDQILMDLWAAAYDLGLYASHGYSTHHTNSLCVETIQI